MTRINKKEYTRTISPALHESWMKLRRTGDPETMAEKLQFSRPVIDKALKYGYVSMPELVDKINAFFMDRLKAEESAAAALNKAANL